MAVTFPPFRVFASLCVLCVCGHANISRFAKCSLGIMTWVHTAASKKPMRCWLKCTSLNTSLADGCKTDTRRL